MAKYKTSKGMGAHQSANMLTDEWLTPPEIIEQLGPFDLDPCSPIIRPWDTAKKHFTVNDNGLLQDWNGFVWMNPPYGKYTKDWLNRLALHNNGIALIFARTETEMFFKYVWPLALSVFFIEGRLSFYHVNGQKAKANSGAPSVLIGYGDLAVDRLIKCAIRGKHIILK
jgi:hypothetical protein